MSKPMLMVIIAVAVVLLILIVAWFIRRRRSRRIKPDYYKEQWQTIQRQCASRKNWPKVIQEADQLLDHALRHAGHKGKTTGERLVAAQHVLTSNDTVWYGHKLRNHIVGKDVRTLKKQDILKALNGFRQALRDLGALQ